MPDAADPADEDQARLSLAQMARQLVDDGRAFAEAEVAYLKAQAGERASYAVPGLAMIGAAVALALGALVATVVGIMFLLADWIGLGWSLPITVLTMGLLCYGLIRAGMARVKDSLKPREDR
jgi:hypothetical protein